MKAYAALAFLCLGRAFAWESTLSQTTAEAKAGDLAAQKKLAYFYLNGVEVEQDSNQALFWLKKASEQGDAESQNSLGDLYADDRELFRDPVAAGKWYFRAAAQGNAKAQASLGRLYEEGRGVERDLNEAAKWYRKAAEQGNADGRAWLDALLQSRRAPARKAAAPRPAPTPRPGIDKSPAAPPSRLVQPAPTPPAAQPVQRRQPATAPPPAPEQDPRLLAGAALGAAVLVSVLVMLLSRRRGAPAGDFDAPIALEPLGTEQVALFERQIEQQDFRGAMQTVDRAVPHLKATRALELARWCSQAEAYSLAVALLDERVITGAVAVAEGCETVIDVLDRAGKLETLSESYFARKPPEIMAAYTGAMQKLGKYSEALRTLLRGRYEIRRQIAEGGMGLVLEGYDRQLSRKVAIKRMRPELRVNAKAHEMFLREAKIISSLTHPYIVGIHEIIEDRGDTYLVFDFVEGKTLWDILSDRGRLPLEECQRLFSYVCAAIDCAHSRGIMHRDLKPANIMIDAHGYAKVMDFGLARQAKQTSSQATNADGAGTLAYMSPEQHLGAMRKESDIYALGVCLYEMLTGALPFPGPDFLLQKERLTYPSPRELVPGLPESVEVLIAQALDPEPAKRIGDAATFLDRLNKCK